MLQETAEHTRRRFGVAPATLQHSTRRSAGQLLLRGDDGWEQERDTLQCVHCQQVWIVQPGSGITRSWCFRCVGTTCGGQACVTSCVPFEQAIEAMEARGRLLAQFAAAYA